MMMQMLLARRRMMTMQTSTDYLRFTSQQNGSTVKLYVHGGTPPDLTSKLEYRVNGGAWQTYVLNTNITLDDGEYVEMKRKDGEAVVTQLSTSTSSSVRFSMTGLLAGSGNTMFLLDPKGRSQVIGDYGFFSLFNSQPSLTASPELPATMLGQYCYRGMFAQDTALTAASVLPATTLVEGCYNYMFYGCSILRSIRTFMTDISASQCLANWLNGVAASGDFYCDPSLNIPSGNNGIPSGWTRYNLDGTPY